MNVLGFEVKLLKLTKNGILYRTRIEIHIGQPQFILTQIMCGNIIKNIMTYLGQEGFFDEILPDELVIFDDKEEAVNIGDLV